MIRFNEIEPDYISRHEILKHIDNYKNEPEMTSFESAFLCGVLRKFRPSKIIEIGVAAGATTAIVLQCMTSIKSDFEMFSVDCNPRYYREPDRYATGFMGDQARSYLLDHGKRFSHNFLFDNAACYYMDEIGEGIDCVILDTVHLLPGELLDFLTILPYLKEGCVVVLHDISHNLESKMVYSFATGILFSVVKADKYLNYDDERSKTGGYPNIGAFVIGKDTYSNVEDVFLSLMTTWNYIPDNKLILQYSESINAAYNKTNRWLWSEALELNRNVFSTKSTISYFYNQV